jgi:anionic cell wall polymer biosynthesis LytR-Cps2A-Psr (LCP) family protein
VSVDFGGIVKIVDVLGGIVVDIPKTFDDPFYPITGEENNVCGKTEEEIFTLKNKFAGYQLETQFTCRYEHLHYDKGPVKLSGTETLKIARSRHGDSDFGRSERQFAIIKGISDKLISMKALENSGGIIDTLLKIVKTDMNIGVIKTLTVVLGNPGEYKVKSIHLTTDNVLNEGKSSDGQYILNPKAGMFNFTEIKKFISDNLI